MIDITDGEAVVVQTRQRIHKHYDIDVTIGIETQNLEIDIYHNEDLDGKNAEIDFIKVDTGQFDSVDEGTDMSNDLGVFLEDWLDKVFPGLTEETQEDFDAIFAAVWDYIEAKGLH